MEVGNRVECDRVEDAPQVRLQHLQPWQKRRRGHLPTGMPVQGVD